MKQQLTFITNGADVKRYHTVSTIQTETVGHHSHGVALLCMLLSPECSASLLEAALLHDLAEHHTGDIPSPAKRLYGINAQVSDVEDRLLSEAGLSMPELTEAETRTLKLADLAQGALFCAREISMGNNRAREVFERYMSYAWGMLPKGREYNLFSHLRESVV